MFITVAYLGKKYDLINLSDKSFKEYDYHRYISLPIK